jgi:hypothetical protein
MPAGRNAYLNNGKPLPLTYLILFPCYVKLSNEKRLHHVAGRSKESEFVCQHDNMMRCFYFYTYGT